MSKNIFLSAFAAGAFAVASVVSSATAFADPDTVAHPVANGNSMYQQRSKFSVDLGFSFAKPDRDVEQRSAGVLFGQRSGSDSSTITSLGIDYRIPLGLLFGFSNLGNIGNMGNVGTDHSSGFYPKGPVAGAWGRVFLGGDDQNSVALDFHPVPVGNDTSAEYSKKYFIMPYVGYEFGFVLGNLPPADFTIFTGLRLEGREAKFTTNENGTVSSFKDSETDVGFTLGFDVDMPLPGLFNIGNAGNVGIANTPFGPVPFIRFGAAIDWAPDMKVTGTSASNFVYTDKLDGGATTRIFIGAGVIF